MQMFSVYCMFKKFSKPSDHGQLRDGETQTRASHRIYHDPKDYLAPGVSNRSLEILESKNGSNELRGSGGFVIEAAVEATTYVTLVVVVVEIVVVAMFGGGDEGYSSGAMEIVVIVTIYVAWVVVVVVAVT
ncbi:hypothetical protein LXL04_001830 [Taraxacum kok-saghyz]